MGKKDRLFPAEAGLLAALCAVLLSGVWAVSRQDSLAERMVRLHVIAASDSAADQTAKLAVRDAVLERLAPALETAADAAEARENLTAALPSLEALAEEVAAVPARAALSREVYPTRRYGSFGLPAGEYVSLRIVLGEGEGHNWWCVVYPPLCAAGEIRPVGALEGDDVRLLTEDGPGYEIRFRVLEWWGALRSRPGAPETETEETQPGAA